jgi:4-amino-4-deoxy-L-arabinose transferase-like glycosyltransferase
MGRWYGVLFIIALALRLALTAATVGLGAPPKADANPDQVDYELLAHHLATGHGYAMEIGKPTACRAPGTPFVLYPVYKLFGRDYFAARVWFAFLSALCVPLVGLMAQRVWSPTAGVLAALWLCCYPGHAYYALHFLSETPATFLLSVAVLLQLDSARRPFHWRDVGIGLSIGLGILVRPSFAILAATACLLPFVMRELSWRQRLVKGVLLGVAVWVVLGPWFVRNKLVMNKATIATVVPGYTFWGANNDRTYNDPAVIGYWIVCSDLEDAEHSLAGNELEQDAAAWRYGWAYVNAHQRDLPKVFLHRFGRVIGAYSESENRIVDGAFRVAWLVSLPFVVLGLFHLARTRTMASAILVQPFLMVLATTVIFYGCARFRDVIAPVLAVLVAVGFCMVARRISPHFAPRC